jgi:hypothetical protein
MDLTYDEYLSFVNSLFMQEFLDFDYHFGYSESTRESMEIVE